MIAAQKIAKTRQLVVCVNITLLPSVYNKKQQKLLQGYAIQLAQQRSNQSNDLNYCITMVSKFDVCLTFLHYTYVSN